MSAQTDELPVDLLRLVAEPLRARIIELLASEALCVCHLVEETGAGQTNVSNHLRQLRRAELVSTEPHGRYTYYRLRPDALRGLAAALLQVADAADANTSVRRPCP